MWAQDHASGIFLTYWIFLFRIMMQSKAHPTGRLYFSIIWDSWLFLGWKWFKNTPLSRPVTKLDLQQNKKHVRSSQGKSYWVPEFPADSSAAFCLVTAFANNLPFHFSRNSNRRAEITARQPLDAAHRMELISPLYIEASFRRVVLFPRCVQLCLQLLMLRWICLFE